MNTNMLMCGCIDYVWKLLLTDILMLICQLGGKLFRSQKHIVYINMYPCVFPQFSKLYHGVKRANNPPHIFATADAAYQGMVSFCKDQVFCRNIVMMKMKTLKKTIESNISYVLKKRLLG